MKKVIFLLSCLVLVFFNSCSNDEFIDANKTEIETELSFEEVSTLHGSIIGDAIGAVKGIWKGVGRSIGNLIFGPSGAVLTITESV